MQPDTLNIVDEPWPSDVERWEPPLPEEPPPQGRHDGPTETVRRAIRLLTLDDLVNLPDPTWLVRDWLPQHGLSVLYGPSGSYKSFIALAWALHVASGTPWFGHEVEPGPVVYLSLEGGYGLQKRIEAWQTEFPDADLSQFRAVVMPLSLLESSTVEELAAAITEAVDRPALIIVDTMSRAMLGGDENSPTDVGDLIAALDVLIFRWACAALLVHHTGHGDKTRERGHSSLPAAADCRIGVTRSEDRVTVTQVKAKDSEEQPPILLVRRIVELDGDDQYGRRRSSIVLDHGGVATVDPGRDRAPELCEQAVLDAIDQADEPLSKRGIEKAVTGHGSEAIREAIDRLILKKKIERETVGRAHKHRIAKQPPLAGGTAV